MWAHLAEEFGAELRSKGARQERDRGGGAGRLLGVFSSYEASTT
jgi:hypothetical protein